MPPNGITAAANAGVEAMTMSFSSSLAAMSGRRETGDVSFQSLFESTARNYETSSKSMMQMRDYEKESTVNRATGEVRKTASVNADTDAVTQKARSAEVQQSEAGEEAVTGKSQSDAELNEKLQKLLGKASDEILAALDISPQELEKWLEENGLTMMSLLDPQVLTQLVLDTNGAEQIEALLTNEDMLNQLRTVLENVSELVKEFEQQNPEAAELLQTGKVTGESELNGESIREEAASTGNKNTQETLTGKAENTGDENVQSSVMADEGEKMEKTYSSQKGSAHASDDQPEGKTVRVTVEKETSDTHHEQRGGQQSSPESMFEHFTSRLTEAAMNNADVSQQAELGARFREIVNQISEQIKITVKPSQTSLDMQLNPENLGRVSLNITSKDGVMTAQLTTQTQVAKEAIESQVQQLRENIESQGIKVEAIEVTVSNFAFSQSKDAESQADSQTKENRGKKHIGGAGVEAGKDIVAEENTRIRQSVDGSTVDYVA